MSKSIDRRSFLRLGRRKKPAAPRGFDLDSFYRQREVLGLVGLVPPSITRRTEIEVPTTRVGVPEPGDD
jgi:hypothetical protein